MTLPDESRDQIGKSQEIWDWLVHPLRVVADNTEGGLREVRFGLVNCLINGHKNSPKKCPRKITLKCPQNVTQKEDFSWTKVSTRCHLLG